MLSQLYIENIAVIQKATIQLEGGFNVFTGETGAGKTALISACKRLFQSTLYNELHELFSHDIQITDIIYEFMDRHGIDRSERNWETIRQMYARMRKKSQAQKG